MDAEYLNEQELATYLGTSTSTLKRWRTLRKGPEYIRLGNFIRYPLTAVRAFEANSTVKPAPPRQPVAQETMPPTQPEEVKLNPEQQAVLTRMRAFLGSPRSDPRVP
ncbi:helix-turn-helix transcriptional regulator [Thauera sp. WH-2]|uniref:helix-turn-helix transcriptional regulator n=1 Tax=Thauera sp. WH-2 TaxID=3401574 RepID=UPI003AAA995B